MGLPRQLRLTRKYQFDRVLKERMVQLRNGPFRIYAAGNIETVPRLGLIVGKRHAKRAVDRNRIKRALRESFYQGHHQLGAFDIVVQLIDAVPDTWLQENSNTLWRSLQATLERDHNVSTSA